MNSISHKLKGTVWIYQGPSPWYFVTISNSNVENIKKEVIFLRGFKSIRVEIKLGGSRWQTSIFPHKKGAYVLPIKKSIRLSEKIDAGSKINFILKVI